MNAPHVFHNRGGICAEQLLAELARKQHGVVSLPQLLELGFSRRQIEYRVARDRLHPVHASVFAVGHRRLSPLGRCTAAGLTAGDGAGVSHRAAIWLFGLPQELPETIDISGPRRRRSQRGIRAHEVLLPPDELTTHEGIPVTIPSRSILDVATMTQPHRLERMIEIAERRQLHSPVSYAELLRRYPHRPGAPNLRAVLGLQQQTGWTRSDWEAMTLTFCDRNGIRRPHTNYLFNCAERDYELDAFWPELMLALEFDSWEHHSGRQAFREDRIRDRNLTRAGVRTIRITAYDLTAGAAELASDLVALTRSER